MVFVRNLMLTTINPSLPLLAGSWGCLGTKCSFKLKLFLKKKKTVREEWTKFEFSAQSLENICHHISFKTWRQLIFLFLLLLHLVLLCFYICFTKRYVTVCTWLGGRLASVSIRLLHLLCHTRSRFKLFLRNSVYHRNRGVQPSISNKADSVKCFGRSVLGIHC